MPIPRIVLCHPAESALKSLQALCLASDSFKHKISIGSLNTDGKTLLDICWNLMIKEYHQEDIIRLNTNPVLGEHIKWVSEQINYNDLAKLAILTWHFDASSQLPPQQLFCFLAHPHDNVDDMYSVFNTRYSNLVASGSTGWLFKREFTELLSFLKNRFQDEWNVLRKCMSLEQPSATPYSIPLWNLPVVDMSLGPRPSRDDCRPYTSSAGAIHSTPQNDDSNCPGQSKQPDDSPFKEKKANDKEQGSGSNRDKDQNSIVIEAEFAQAQDTERQHRIFLQPETHPATKKQLVNKVCGIYAGLVMVEKKCIEIGKWQSKSPNKLSHLQWQALTSLHRLLLHEHNDFFLASQHPSASVALKQFPEKHYMPARMWHYGIHSCLELSRHRLPDSLEHILSFLHLAYAMMTLLLESVPAFEDIWIECLGDLARYWMAVEASNVEVRKRWADVARNWYHRAADKNPSIGRIQHHLAVLARPDMLQQLFHYTKSLVSVRPFPSAGESILFLFDPLLDQERRYGQSDAAFVAAHGYLFKQHPISDLRAPVQEYLSLLKADINRLGAVFKIRGAYMASCNIAAIFQYGSIDAVLPSKFEERFPRPQHQGDGKQGESLKLVHYGSRLAFETFSVFLDQISNENVYPAVHVYLAFIWCMSLNNSIGHIERVVPWSKIAIFLNGMIRSDTEFGVIECDEFPIAEDRKNMPEDFLIRGQVWSQHYFPVDFFKDAMTEDDGRSIEVPSLRASRTNRCWWLGRQLAKYFLYSSRSFSVTLFAQELEKTAHSDPFATEDTDSDKEMQDI